MENKLGSASPELRFTLMKQVASPASQQTIHSARIHDTTTADRSVQKRALPPRLERAADSRSQGRGLERQRAGENLQSIARAVSDPRLLGKGCRREEAGAPAAAGGARESLQSDRDIEGACRLAALAHATRSRRTSRSVDEGRGAAGRRAWAACGDDEADRRDRRYQRNAGV